MKKALIALAATLVSVAAFAQGQIAFNTRVLPDVDAPITFDGGDPVANAQAQLYLVGAGGALTALTPATTFRTDRADRARYVNPVDVDVPAAPGATVTVRVYAFTQGTNPLSGGLGTAFKEITITGLGGGTLPPSNLTGLTGFNVPVVPEPSTLALGVLGAAALLFRRRK
jgi:hypothetical protein